VSAFPRPLTVCRHEAAHAVIAHTTGFHVFELVIDRLGGHIDHASFRKVPDPLRLGMVWMAGHAADLLWSNERMMSVVDHRAMVRMGFYRESFPALLALAQGQCLVYEREIRRVAAALKKGDLDRRAFLKALREPPTEADRNAAVHGRRWSKQQADERADRALSIAAERANSRKRRGAK
jgi:hypothetical protein